jgi:hypothetical protein
MEMGKIILFIFQHMVPSNLGCIKVHLPLIFFPSGSFTLKLRRQPKRVKLRIFYKQFTVCGSAPEFDFWGHEREVKFLTPE